MIESFYTVHSALHRPTLVGAWEHPSWARSQTIELTSVHPKSSAHHPKTCARLLYDDDALYGSFVVDDQYVLSRHRAHQSMVCEDSCVEFFFKPSVAAGYFNLEFNCAGVCLAEYHPLQSPRTLVDVTPLEIWSDGPRASTEVNTPVRWQLAFRVPWSLLSAHLPQCHPKHFSDARGNFFKCADASSHPHWLSWQSVGDKLNFHQPDKFAPMRWAGAKA